MGTLINPREEHPPFRIGMRVRIQAQFSDGTSKRGVIRAYLPGRPWSWHVLPDGWTHDTLGMAFATDELAPEEQQAGGDDHGDE